MTHSIRTRGWTGRSVLLIALAFLLPATPTSAEDTAPSRVVVLGEVQGAAETVTKLLQHLELVDNAGVWAGGTAVLVQTGDLIDGGENSRAAMDLFMRLQVEAAAAGGEVIVLMGNHEAMNILGELRDVNYMTYATFADADSEARQKRFFDEYVAWKKERAAATGTEFVADEEFTADWFALHPPGWVEYVAAMSPDGTYGRWLRTLPVAVEIEEVLYIHAGVSPEMKGMTVEQINTRAAEEIRRFDEDRARMASEGLCLALCTAREMVASINDEIAYLNTLDTSQRHRGNPRMVRAAELQHLGDWGSWSVLTDKGPLWFRGTAGWDEKQKTAEMKNILEATGVGRMVTGQGDGKERVIHTRFDDSVVLTSVDLSDNPWDGGGEPAALEIAGGSYAVVTMDGRSVLINGS